MGRLLRGSMMGLMVTRKLTWLKNFVFKRAISIEWIVSVQGEKKKKKECPVQNGKNGEIDSGQSNLGNGTQSNGKIENQKILKI